MAYSDTPLRLRINGGDWKTEKGQRARVLRYWWDNRSQWHTEWEATLALRSTVVHSRMADLKRLHGEMFDSKEGGKTKGVRGRKLYRLKPMVEVQDGEAAHG